MSQREMLRTPGMRVALAALGASLIVTAWTLVHALRVLPVPDLPPTAVASLETIARGAARSSIDIGAAVENDVFSADRSAPAAGYRMPGEAGPNDRPMAQPEKPTVLGTAVATDGRSFATMMMNDARPTLVHVGDKIGEWVVKSIDRGKVVLMNGSTRIEVTVPRPGT